MLLGTGLGQRLRGFFMKGYQKALAAMLQNAR